MLFSNKCRHKSDKNSSRLNRRSMCYSYNQKSEGDNYLKYFDDKSSSKNLTSKRLSGKI